MIVCVSMMTDEWRNTTCESQQTKSPHHHSELDFSDIGKHESASNLRTE